MNKEEIKKDLINILKNQCDNAPFDYCCGCDCDECRARVITNAGYCRVTDDEVVIKKAEYMDFLRISLDEIKMHGEFLDGFSQGYEQAKQETAREILRTIKTAYGDNDGLVLWLTTTYAIEVEDQNE